MIVAIAADGTALKPALTIQRKTYENNILLYWYAPSRVNIHFQKKGFENRDIFDDWFETIFINELLQRRVLHIYHETALLIFDCCTSHSNPFIIEQAAEYDVYLLTFLPHSSDQKQSLDIVLFGLFKACLGRMQTSLSLHPLSRELIRCLSSWQAV